MVRELDRGSAGRLVGVRSTPEKLATLTSPQWSMTGESKALECPVATGHIKDSVPLVERSRALCPGGRFPPSFIHQ